ITSDAVRLTTEVHNPIAIEARRIRLDLFEKHMKTDDKVRIQYTTKHARIANGWKKWIGENRGIERLGTVQVKQQQEAAFGEWVQKDPELTERYGRLLTEFKDVYARYTPATRQSTYITEAALAAEVLRLPGRFFDLIDYAAGKDATSEGLKEQGAKLWPRMASFYKDYDAATDQDVMASTLKYYWDNMSTTYVPPYLRKLYKKHRGDFQSMAAHIMGRSVFCRPGEIEAMLKSGQRKPIRALQQDPAMLIAEGFIDYHDACLLPVTEASESRLDSLYRCYVAAIMKMQPERRFYPDANLTLRVTYGQVDDYFPRDAVRYKHFTTLDGIMEKEAMGVYDYGVPERLRELHAAQDYGDYAAEDGLMHTCFTASNHTTGGNSGSPVINAEGHLIGINFDRNWEGTMSDIDYDPDQCRNISLDIRYCLFIIDVYAGARHLVEEMTVVK
ncbi:MAG TPA: S46 family peptidase, partial [Bacteroidales bacterium]|nr:S46 family peptidase [Bacteroidales bacterium]